MIFSRFSTRCHRASLTVVSLAALAATAVSATAVSATPSMTPQVPTIRPTVDLSAALRETPRAAERGPILPPALSSELRALVLQFGPKTRGVAPIPFSADELKTRFGVEGAAAADATITIILRVTNAADRAALSRFVTFLTEEALPDGGARIVGQIPIRRLKAVATLSGIDRIESVPESHVTAR